jgi:hypothetical protein
MLRVRHLHSQAVRIEFCQYELDVTS